MQPFTTLTAIAAPLPVANIDTDKIVPARFLKTIHRAGLGTALFAGLREDPDFVLNRAPWTGAGILVAGDNFGCGSSREHAPWALLDFGIRCVIAPGIADIFRNNCFKNGILPIVLPVEEVDRLSALASEAVTARMTVDLERRQIAAGALRIAFPVDAARRRDLLRGVDEIDGTLACASDIDLYEDNARRARPWLTGVDQDALRGP